MDGVRIGGLWVNEDSSGKKYLGGNLGSHARIRIIKNGFKQKDSEPDYIMYIEDSNKTSEVKNLGDEL